MPYVSLTASENEEQDDSSKWDLRREKSSDQEDEIRKHTKPTSFTFVNLSSQSEASQKDFKQVVRGHVMRQRKKNALFKVRQLKKSQSSHSSHESSEIVKPSSGTTLSRFASNHGIIYPVKMNKELYDVIEHMHSPVFDDASAFRHVWFAMTLSDEASFYQMTATIFAHRSNMPEKRPNDLITARELHVKGIQSVNKRLSNATQDNITQGLVAGVLTFLTYSHILGDEDAYRLHRVGFNRLVSLRGGIKTLEGNSNLILMILWDEVCGACAFDIMPTYTLPREYLTPLHPKPQAKESPQLTRSLRNWRKKFPEHEALAVIMEDLHILVEYIHENEDSLSSDRSLLGMQVNPIMHRLVTLSRRREANDDLGTYTGSAEAVRLAAILLLGGARQKLMIYHIVGDHIKERLANLLESTLDWTMLEDLELWVLMIAGFNTLAPDREHVVDLLSAACEKRSIWSFEEAMDVISSILWVDGLFSEGRARTRKDLLLRYSISERAKLS